MLGALKRREDWVYVVTEKEVTGSQLTIIIGNIIYNSFAGLVGKTKN